MVNVFQKIQRLLRLSKERKPTVTFATSCWEKDWKKLVCDPAYLQTLQIGNHNYPFDDTMLIINNVVDLQTVKRSAEDLVKRKIVHRVIPADDHEQEILSFFELDRSRFKAGSDAHLYENVTDDWVFYNARGILTALYFCQTEYFLYLTGDSFLEEKINWIPRAIDCMNRDPSFKVANLTWNHCYREAKKESYGTKRDFYVSRTGFSDQCFLVRTSDFRQPIYHEVLPEATQYPRGDVLEKRIFSYMRNRDWKRLTYRHGSYMHKNIEG